MREGPPVEFLFLLDDGVQRFVVSRCTLCGEILDMLDRVLHVESHPDYDGEVAGVE